MKKTLSVNLGGSVYHIDEDAYQLLMDYLQDVNAYLNQPSAEEVLNDIEQRMSELFSQWMQGKRTVIVVADVLRVIDILGRPEQFDSNEESDRKTKEQSNSTSEGSQRTEERRQEPVKRLYRDTQNSMLGGVCSGLAVYLNVSIGLIRLLIFLMVWFYGTGLLLYIAAWIIIPEAKTAAQRLEMRGEDVNIDNIEKKVREEAGRVKDHADGYVRSGRYHESAHSSRNGFAEIVRIFLIIVGVFLGVPVFLFLLVLLFVLITTWTGGVFLMSLFPVEMHSFSPFFENPVNVVWMSFGLLLTIGIPFIAIFRLIFSGIFKFKSVARWEIWLGTILWLIGIGLCIWRF